MKALKCPQCQADIELDETREFGFCNYCGTKILIKEFASSDRTEDIKNFLARAKEYRVNGDFIKANEYYNKVLDLDINNNEARMALVQIAPYIKKSAPYTVGKASQVTVVALTEMTAKCKLPNDDTIQLHISNISSDKSKKITDLLHIGDILNVIYKGVDKMGHPLFREANLDKEKLSEENMTVVERARYLEEKRKQNTNEKLNKKEFELANKICNIIKSYMMEGKHDIVGYYCYNCDDGYSSNYIERDENCAVNITSFYNTNLLIRQMQNILSEYGLNNVLLQMKHIHKVNRVKETGNSFLFGIPKYKTEIIDKDLLYICIHW
mgnify:CR=1 FL=1